MEKIFQSQWHGINFKSFAKLSEKQMAESKFYEKFYKIFFEKFETYNDLDSKWIREKLACIQILEKSKKFNKTAKILSIGCGIGIIEKELITQHGFSNIEVTEVSMQPLKWLKKYLPLNKMHVGFFPECIPAENTYDFIFLSGIEYVFDDKDLLKLLTDVNKLLNKSGECVLLSVSHIKSGIIYNIIRTLRRYKNSIMNAEKGQFWGYARNTQELSRIITKSGFRIIEDGRDEKSLPGTYWSMFVKKN
jgi:2-polyprenyl-3-methyl-5-hydroxy-6-metoxy-1,4-benzoquinol methylase